MWSLSGQPAAVVALCVSGSSSDASYFRVVGWGYYYMVTVFAGMHIGIRSHLRLDFQDGCFSLGRLDIRTSVSVSRRRLGSTTSVPYNYPNIR